MNGNIKSPQTRRQFIGRATAAAAGLGLFGLGARAYGRTMGANDRLVLGAIGCGAMARHNVKKLMEVAGVEFAAVCDVDSNHLDQVADQIGRGGRGAPKKFRDFRRVLEMKEVDGVVINTPDHWHAIPFIAACEAGKDIYCEKPVSHSFVEAQAMLAAAVRFQPVVQVGTWQRSMAHFREAIDFVRSGQLGDISVCRAWSVRGGEGRRAGIGRQLPRQPPPELDWDFWLGPAPKRGYQPNRCHSTWRSFFDYGGGPMTDWGTHLLDIVLLGMNQTDPLSVAGVGGVFVTDDDRDTPDTMQALYRFPNFVLNWEHRSNNGRGLDGGRGHGVEFIGTNGTLIVDREGCHYHPEREDFAPPPFSVKEDSTHWRNFVDCVKSRRQPVADIASMAKTTMLCHLGNISLQAGRTLQWDAKKQDVANSGEVRHCPSYARDYRGPWNLKRWPA